MPPPTVFLAPGETATTINLNEKRPSCLILLLVLALPVVFCLGAAAFGFFTAKARTASPTATVIASATITPSYTATSTGTVTPRPTDTPQPPTRTATRALANSGQPVRMMTLTPSATITPTATTSPTATPCALYYRVRVGDNLSSIAARYRVRTASILRLNTIPNPDLLYVGRILKIPACLYPTQTPRPTNTPIPPTSTLIMRRNFDDP